MTDITVSLSQQMQADYMDYSMAVLLGRAIPDLYDGLKPVQRRVLQTMLEENLKPDGRFVKCARVTGLTSAFFHPHGGCYGALVNMATEWTNNIPWVNGHGNFGSSVDGPAAERYTECKLRPAAVDILLQDKETWETKENYDASRKEAIRFNTAIPSVLLNGDTGIAVGFTTKLAPHNLRDIVKAVTSIAKGDKKEAQSSLLPDFPTGCDIVSDESLTEYMATGSGSIRCRAKYEISVQSRDGRAKDRPVVTFTNLPPNVNPEKLGYQIKEALDRGRIEGIAEITDESDLSGDRLSVIGKPGVNAEQLAQQLFAATDLDTKYSTKTLVIDGVRPIELSPVEVCEKWFEWRLARLEIKFSHERELAEHRLELVRGFIKAIDLIDTVIKIIRASSSPNEAMLELVSNRKLQFTNDQARAILDMRLRALTNLDNDELLAEQSQLVENLLVLTRLVENRDVRSKWALKQMNDLAKRHGNARNSLIVDTPTAYKVEKNKGVTGPVGVAKPRFMQINTTKGIIEQVKGPRGALVVESGEKVIFMTTSGILKKVHSHFKGPIGEGFSSLVLAKLERVVREKRFLTVFRLENHLKAMVLLGSDLCRVTSKGKNFIPVGAELVHFSEESYTIDYVSSRKKSRVLDLTMKEGRPGSKGFIVANLNEISG